MTIGMHPSGLCIGTRFLSWGCSWLQSNLRITATQQTINIYPKVSFFLRLSFSSVHFHTITDYLVHQSGEFTFPRKQVPKRRNLRASNVFPSQDSFSEPAADTKNKNKTTQSKRTPHTFRNNFFFSLFFSFSAL